jgi:hypothetical protein
MEILQKGYFEVSAKRKKKYGKISKTLEGLCFVISVRDHSRSNAGMDDDDDDDKLHLSHQSINLFHFRRSQMAKPSQGCRTSQIIYIQIKFKLQKNT